MASQFTQLLVAAAKCIDLAMLIVSERCALQIWEGDFLKSKTPN